MHAITPTDTMILTATKIAGAIADVAIEVANSIEEVIADYAIEHLVVDEKTGYVTFDLVTLDVYGEEITTVAVDFTVPDGELASEIDSSTAHDIAAYIGAEAALLMA